jgi:hypothetical protein
MFAIRETVIQLPVFFYTEWRGIWSLTVMEEQMLAALATK